MRVRKLLPFASALLVATFLPGVGAAQNQSQNPNPNSRPAQPGTINYVEGQAFIDNQPLSTNSVGSVQLQAGQSLNTQAGKVEVLLVPGTFLRVADNGSVKMVNLGLANTEVEIDKGRAMVEATDINKNNDIRVDMNGVTTKILKNGLYDFEADQSTIRVFKGKAEVLVNDKKIELGKERELVLNANGKPKAEDFDARKYEDDFFRWSALRSGYLAEASADQARIYVNGGPGWFGPGWYWDPWFGAYTFIPGAGIVYSPFGWGFYSPIVVYRTPFFYGGYWGRPHRFGDFHYPYGHGFEPRPGFRGPVGGFHGGGLRGGIGGARGGVGGHR
jgi:FecR protein